MIATAEIIQKINQLKMCRLHFESRLIRNYVEMDAPDQANAQHVLAFIDEQIGWFEERV